MMQFAVTGGAGFIGRHLTKFLIESGHSVKVIDNLHRGKMENLSGLGDRLEFHKLDILDLAELESAVKNTDGIFHQAALTSVPESYLQKEKYFEVNIKGTENVFKLAHKHGLKVVHASSSSVYGNQKKMPIAEDSERKPINPYGNTKLEGELLAERYSKMGTRIIGLRYFNVYGPGQTPDYAGVITKFQENIAKDKSPVVFGDGSQVRDFVAVHDVAKANHMAMQSQLEFGFVNVGTGVATTIKDLAEIMIGLSKKPLKPTYDALPEGDVMASQADTELASRVISWRSETSLEDGLRSYFFK